MAKKHEKILNLDEKVCRMGKISNNLEKHGNEWVTAFSIPISGLLLTKDELNAFMCDKYCHTSWFDTKGNLVSPMAWWGEEDFAVSQEFESDALTVIVSGEKPLEFEADRPNGDEDEDDDEEGVPACSLSRITLRPQVGGMTEMRFSLYLRPGIGKTNLLLQDHQHREIKLTLSDAKAAAKKARQPELPMGAPEEGEKQASGPFPTH